MDEPLTAELVRRAEAIAARVDDAESFSDVKAAGGSAYEDLLRAVRALDARFAFDRDGRPAAIAAVREALPLMERDLFEAVLEDHACEIAAIEEALFHVLRACARRVAPGD